MSSLAKQISVPIFSGQNYDYWAIKMKTYFQSQKLWELVEEGVTLTEDSSTSSSAEKGKLENKKAKDSEALYYIQTTVADHIFPRISVATSAKEAWSILQKEYQGSAKVRIIKLQTLRRDFENMKMKDSETIDEYYTKVRELVNQLKAYGEDIPEKRVVEKLLISVTEKYDPIVTTIEETKDITTLTVTELVGSLEAYEKRRIAETGEATWYIDSAASNHMTYNKGAFQTLDESFKTNVKLGDNHIVKVEGKGSVAINTKNVSQMMEKGYTLRFGGDSCTIYDNKDKTLKIAEVRMKEHRCFPIHLQYMGRTAMKAQEDQSWLWHRRLGHFNFQGLKILHQKKMMTDLPQIQAVEGACEACLQGKQHKKPFPSETSWRAKAVLELIHTDVCGPMRTPSHEQNRYFIIFIDDYSRMTWVYFMREKSEVFKVFKKFKNLVEKQSGRSIKVLRSDRGKEYNNSEFDKFCEEEGEKLAKSFLCRSSLHCSLSTQQVSTKAVQNMTPIEAWSDKKPSAKHLRVFGSICYVHIPIDKRHKLEEKTEKGSFSATSHSQKATESTT
ncbi:UNVERIFIED_CONTAM: Retrovirus-related Pol polyprotein from transposon TNT 1-94 [Sesamum angustifolium]|uniref:Retrovirus-related Pol polyprotein from transposon TNT 1-94 n=1 Tax=Sesamum angustifolium TaxID=2727405 RepID=A0AAW2ML16_9LAMI